jgi:multicomponent Na+:H+ antiporter subunit G
MSSPAIDIIIWILLFIGTGFGFIGLIGLLLFPDTKSRMYTVVRAGLISISSVGCAVIIYGLNAAQTFGGDIYFTFMLHTLLLVLVVLSGNVIIAKIIPEKKMSASCSPAPQEKSRKTGNKKQQ